MASLVPSEFARSNRRWSGELSLASFARLSEACGGIEGSVRVQLDFSIDANSRIRVVGEVQSPAELMCYGCLRKRPCKIEATVDVRIVKTEQEARKIFSEFDTMVLAEGPTTIQELIEDDVLLSIPSKVCDKGGNCEHRLAVQNEPDTNEHRPFEQLQALVKTTK